MRIGVLSDTHGDRDSIRRVVEQAGPVAAWIHAGDYRRDADYLADLTKIPVHGVIGNCDSPHEGLPELFLNIAGYTIMVTHGHRYHVKEGIQELAWWARHYEAPIVIYGHTHRAMIQQDQDVLILNPGSPSSPRGGTAASFGIIELLPGEIRPSLVRIK